jgi:hypothetical protein
MDIIGRARTPSGVDSIKEKASVPEFSKAGKHCEDVMDVFPADDQELQHKIEQLIVDGKVDLPKWPWPLPRRYRQFSGEDRVRGWQIVKIAEKLGLIPKATQCTICGTASGRIERHNEDYSRPLLAKPICRSCHRKLHLRFRYPDQWVRHVSKHGDGAQWFEHLEM